jgi:hypothetical protein
MLAILAAVAVPKSEGLNHYDSSPRTANTLAGGQDAGEQG